MAERLALPLLFPSPPPVKTLFLCQTHHQNPTLQPNSPPPVLQDLLLRHNSKSQQPIDPQVRIRTRLGRSRDLNRGKRWTHNNLSSQGQQVLNSLIDISFDSNQLDVVLAKLFEQYQENPNVGTDFFDC
ncbi:hypothetical protein like AT5G02860 [Hibiscus trionum]|uniref:Uncharacterized protein n=1 Tax=Hibiscus trionum TaxID=183268 RepID=A0A9W7M8D5_HIBTR|nr:hypothetical protein like AT5G02860 [Hibiscus trionum]